MASSFDPSNVDLTTADPAQVVCFLELGKNEYDGMLGARISSIFVIFAISTVSTFFPVVAKRARRFKIPLYVYLFARYFGTGVIIATAFVHLLDPAYEEIGPNTCVGMTGNWSQYSWPPAIALTSTIAVFLMDFGAELYVEWKYGITKGEPRGDIVRETNERKGRRSRDFPVQQCEKGGAWDIGDFADSVAAERSFRQQIAALLILEFGVIFHSVIIGLNLGVCGSEFSTLYPVLVFHQSFEGLGIGARMSAIQFKRKSWLPWLLCMAYGLTTPISIAIGLGLRTTYNPNGVTANIVSGVLDAISAGILIYTCLVELLARDFLFDPCRTNSRKRLSFMTVCTVAGAGIMALIGKWA
ncbi:high affinity zinc ion transporter [Penicillium canescens]|nr:high affinity zinc ion transporter [Penicillium canescens]